MCVCVSVVCALRVCVYLCMHVSMCVSVCAVVQSWSEQPPVFEPAWGKSESAPQRTCGVPISFSPSIPAGSPYHSPSLQLLCLPVTSLWGNLQQTA